jgi:hypothetical protein
MAVAVADLVSKVERRAGFALLDVGLFLDGPDGTTHAILDGLYRGLLSIGVVPADPLVLADADLAGLSGAGVQRVLDVAEKHGIDLVLGRWHQAVRTQAIDAVAKADDVRGGWLWEEKQALLRRQADLALILAVPFIDPLQSAGNVAVVNRDPCTDPCWPYPGACE